MERQEVEALWDEVEALLSNSAYIAAPATVSPSSSFFLFLPPISPFLPSSPPLPTRNANPRDHCEKTPNKQNNKRILSKPAMKP